MFLTYEAFKSPAQLMPRATNWASVEYMTVSAAFIVTICHPEDGKNNTLLMGSEQHLVSFLVSDQKAAVKAVHVLFPPSWSPSGDWLVARAVRIERQDQVGTWQTPSIVTTLEDGTRFTGFPMCRLEGPAGTLTLLADFG